MFNFKVVASSTFSLNGNVEIRYNNTLLTSTCPDSMLDDMLFCLHRSEIKNEFNSYITTVFKDELNSTELLALCDELYMFLSTKCALFR